MKCLVCETDMVSDVAWRKLPKAERAGRSKHQARGLCGLCYQRAGKDGSVIDFERINFSADMMLDEVAYLIEDGMSTFRMVAERLDVTPDSVSLALRRAARAGDQRAIDARKVLIR